LHKLAAVLDIDTAYYCKIEKGERRVKKEYITVITNFFQIDEKELLTLWIADQVVAVVGNDKEISDKVLEISKRQINDDE
jgi:transcriptional regulator with XRE-family HTH domain